MKYRFLEIEKKWQGYWEKNKTFKTVEDSSKPKFYILDMFPYPSGAGLHVGHPEGYTATDILSRYKRMRGFTVLHPMGWDAFGLPAERYAMQTNIHPRTTTEENIATFRRQIKMLGLSYDWDREVDTTDPNYYRWTQWIFLQIYNAWYDPRIQKALPINSLVKELDTKGTRDIDVDFHLSAEKWRSLSDQEKESILSRFRLAYIAEVPVNWCEELGTVLANEEVDEWTEKGYSVVRRPMRQWMMRITAYADRLLQDANELDWPASTLEQQRNWIGKSEGAQIDFPIKNSENYIRVFTTRPDTIFGATYMVLAPEHPLVDFVTASAMQSEVERYRKLAVMKSDVERGTEREKTGIFTGGFAVNPATNEEIPIWIADYVLMTYGTGAIMAVPGHDQRDYDFAKKHELPIVKVVEGGESESEAFEGEGRGLNSSNAEVSINGLLTPEAKKLIVRWLEEKNCGKGKIQYKLHDWLFSRQRYWGEPIPIIFYEDGTVRQVPEHELPLLLPPLDKFQPSGTTESPLALATDWVNVLDPETGMKGRRETNTMPQWAGSCWYYLRYIDPHNRERLCDPEKEKYWMPIDLYIGGAEHAVLHLMYARFWHKALYDLGHVSTKEPFIKLRHQGIILGEDSRKMSKSRGNVINPDVVVQEYGADSMRLFEMFMGPLEEMKPWSTRGVEGVFRFLNRVWRLFIGEDGNIESSIKDIDPTPEFERTYHQTVQKVTADIESLRFNTAISQLMIFTNEAMKLEIKPLKLLENFVLLLSPFAPHLAEELWGRLGHEMTLGYAEWPSYDAAKAIDDTVEVVFQVNGKIRAKKQVPLDTSEDELEQMALNDANVQRHLDGKSMKRKVIVKNKLVNFVVY